MEQRRNVMTVARRIVEHVEEAGFADAARIVPEQTCVSIHMDGAGGGRRACTIIIRENRGTMDFLDEQRRVKEVGEEEALDCLADWLGEPCLAVPASAGTASLPDRVALTALHAGASVRLNHADAAVCVRLGRRRMMVYLSRDGADFIRVTGSVGPGARRLDSRRVWSDDDLFDTVDDFLGI